MAFQLGEGFFEALQRLDGQTRTVGAVRIILSLDKFGHLTKLCAARCNQIRQHFVA